MFEAGCCGERVLKCFPNNDIAVQSSIIDMWLLSSGNAIQTVTSSDKVKLITVRSTCFEAASTTGGSGVVSQGTLSVYVWVVRYRYGHCTGVQCTVGVSGQQVVNVQVGSKSIGMVSVQVSHECLACSRWSADSE